MYLIDGHNLIPHMPGLSLSQPDDEERLITMLQNFARIRRKKIEVFFDRAAPGRGGGSSRGTIRVHFVTSPGTADQAIRRRLKSLARQAQNWQVVSSDRAVQASARQAHAKVISSVEFADLLLNALRSAEISSSDPDSFNSDTEYWLEQFRRRRTQD